MSRVNWTDERTCRMVSKITKQKTLRLIVHSGPWWAIQQPMSIHLKKSIPNFKAVVTFQKVRMERQEVNLYTRLEIFDNFLLPDSLLVAMVPRVIIALRLTKTLVWAMSWHRGSKAPSPTRDTLFSSPYKGDKTWNWDILQDAFLT